VGDSCQSVIAAFRACCCPLVKSSRAAQRFAAFVRYWKKTAEHFSLRPCSFHSLRSLVRKGSSVFFSGPVAGGYRQQAFVGNRCLSVIAVFRNCFNPSLIGLAGKGQLCSLC